MLMPTENIFLKMEHLFLYTVVSVTFVVTVKSILAVYKYPLIFMISSVFPDYRQKDFIKLNDIRNQVM